MKGITNAQTAENMCKYCFGVDFPLCQSCVDAESVKPKYVWLSKQLKQTSPTSNQKYL